MSEEKKVYNSISELANKESEVVEAENEVENEPVENVKSEDLQIISDLDEIAPKEEKDDKMQMDDTAFWEEINDQLDESIVETDRLLREAIDEKELERANEEDEKILNGDTSVDEFSDDDIEDSSNDVLFEEDDEEFMPKKVYNKHALNVENTGLFDDEDEEFSDNDIEDELPEDDNEEEKEFIKNIQTSIKDQIKPINHPIDISGFSFSKKHLSANKILKNQEKEVGRVVNWMLYTTGKKIAMREFKGYEIDQLATSNLNGRTQFKMYQDVFKLIYNHIVEEDKIPFEPWLKSIKFADMNDLYFAVYQACFTGANSIPYSCPNDKCGNVFMQDVAIEDMVKYKDDETKKRAEELLNGEYTVDGTEDIEVIMISDSYAVGLKKPSLYNVYFELSIIDEDFRDKYSAFLGFMSYIDDIYYIDRENSELISIDVSIADPRNTSKAIKNKIMQYSKILRTLTSDQFSALQSHIYNIDQETNKIEYRLPATECPKCHTKINAETSDPEQMIFLRRQLLLIANSSIN